MRGSPGARARLRPARVDNRTLVPHTTAPAQGLQRRYDSSEISARSDQFRNLIQMSENIMHVTDESFEQDVLGSDSPVLVDYWAEWCGPCKAIAPILDEIAAEYDGKLRIAKLNIDDNPGTPPKYGIRGIPTLMLFKGGNVEATKVGTVSKSQLAAFIDSNI
jgi:thioredoxin 1